MSKYIKGSFEIKGTSIKPIIKLIDEQITKRHNQAIEQGLDWEKWIQPQSLGDELTYCNFNIMERHKSVVQLKSYEIPAGQGRVANLISWLRKQVHDLVIYYVNMLGKKQIIFNETVARAIASHQSKVEELQETVSTLEERVKILEAQLRDKEL